MNMPTPELHTYVPLSAGAQLRAYRENAQLTVDDVAHQLQLSRRQVLAIENDELDALPGPTFVRGFIRNYARLLRVDPIPLLEASNLVAPAASSSIERIAPTMGELPAASAPSASWSRWLIPLGLMVVLAAGIFYYDFGGVSTGIRKVRKDSADAIVAMPTAPIAPALPATDGSSGAADATKASTQTPVPSGASGTAGAAMSTAGAAAGTATPPAATPPAATPPETALAAPAGTGRIDLKVSGASWIEIRDARGEILFSKTLPANAEQSVTGAVPLSLRVGNARVVRAQFNGAPVDLAPYTQREIARLTLPLPRR
jgi:cytoskeleton protein RodZ